jgi:hypothetical protein
VIPKVRAADTITVPATARYGETGSFRRHRTTIPATASNVTG